MKTFRILLTLAILTVTVSIKATESWRTHLMYSSVTQVAETPNKVFGLADGALFSYDKNSQKIVVYSKINGLSDNKIVLISYHPNSRLLLIVYENANIDLMDENEKIYNLPEIKNKPLTTNKLITNINIIDNIGYLSSSFGIITLDFNTKSITNNYNLKRVVNAVAINNDSIFAATVNGVFSAPLKSNLLDPNNWILYNNTWCSDLELFNNNLIGLIKGSGIFTITKKTTLQKIGSSTISKIKKLENSLYMLSSNELRIAQNWDNISTINCINLSDCSTVNSNMNIWTANLLSGINKIIISDNNYLYSNLTIKPNGPLANSPYRMKFSKEKLMIVGGGAWADRFNTPGYLMTFDKELWDFIRTDTITIPGGVRDFVDIIEDQNEIDHYFVASWGEGLYEFRNNKLVNIFNNTNSPIESVVPNNIHYNRLSSLLYDNNGSLFFSNSWSNNQIKVLNGNKWSQLKYNDLIGVPNLMRISKTSNNNLIALSLRYKPGIFIFNTNNTLDSQIDDKTIFINSIQYSENNQQTSITPNNYYCISEDKREHFWIGTDFGPIILTNAKTVLYESPLFIRPKAQNENGIVEYLLNKNYVSEIAVDATNRKWLGTETNGLYLVNEDGTKIIKHFTYENSPLLSNKILSLAIHPTTGEVFIGTDKGLISYTNDGLESKKSFSEVYAFPNPVKPEFEGDITITGLKYGTTVRIANQAGVTVFEGKATSDEIVWNGKDTSNNRVDTGIYDVYAAVASALESKVTRITIVK